VQEGGAHLRAEAGFVAVGQVQEVRQEKNDLRRERQGGGFLVGKLRADEQAEGVRLDAVAAVGGVGLLSALGFYLLQSEEPSETVNVSLGPRGMLVQGTFRGW